ncbi:MAG: hypothetical protein V3U80_05935 [Flavobacteriaceae bacterium]
MKKITIIIVLSVLISACNSSKKVQKLISSGDYNRAIEISVKKLQKSTKGKKKQKHIVLLENAFARSVEMDLISLKRLEKDPNPSTIEEIFVIYSALQQRQDLIRPLLPLVHKKSGRALFQFNDYTDKINASKATLSDYLYTNAKRNLLSSLKEDARNAHKDLMYLNDLNNNFKDVDQLLKEAHYKGTNFVWVTLENQTNQVIPRRLEDDLLNFNTYGLNEFWTIFHNQKDTKTDYNYQLQLLFTGIDVSPERVNEKHTILEKEVEDGFEYKLDSNGNVARDSLGVAIKIPKYKIIKSDFYEIHQEKASHIAGEVVLNDLKNKQTIDTFPLDSEFIFINDFAEMSGDKRALDNHHLDLIGRREIPFPSNEQMIFDTGEDLKERLKSIIEDLNL